MEETQKVKKQKAPRMTKQEKKESIKEQLNNGVPLFFINLAKFNFKNWNVKDIRLWAEGINKFRVVVKYETTGVRQEWVFKNPTAMLKKAFEEDYQTGLKFNGWSILEGGFSLTRNPNKKRMVCLKYIKDMFFKKPVTTAPHGRIKRKLPRPKPIIKHKKDVAKPPEPVMAVAEAEKEDTTKRSSSNEEGSCTVCYEAKSDCAVFPCAHMVTCEKCAPAIGKTCFYCRREVINKVKIFTV